MMAPTTMLLRPIEERDLELLLGWRNSERIRASMYTSHRITLAEHRSWFERLRLAPDAFSYLFECEGRPLGVVNLNGLDRANGRCHWGFYLGEADAPPGSGSRMAYLALLRVFEELQLHKVVGEVLAFNAASIAYHRKLGFSQEGHFVEHVLKEGRYHDVLSFALLSRDWPRIRCELEKKCL